MPRLTASFWVHAYLRRLSLANIPAFVVQKGDETAGAVFVKSNSLDGNATLYHRIYDQTGTRVWDIFASGVEVDIDQHIEKQRGFDPDIWVIEVEDSKGRTLLDEAGLME